MPRDASTRSLLTAVTSTTTSAALPVLGAKRLTFQFSRANHTSGSSTFTVTGSVDNGTTYVALNILIDNVANTNAQTLTRVASSALSSNTTKLYALDLANFGFTHIKVTGTIATDGDATAKALLEY